MGNDLPSLSVPELLRLYGNVLDELKSRQVVRSLNNPVGDYSEWLVARALNLELERNSNAGFDGTDPEGVRYQVKGRRLHPANASRQLSIIRRLDQRTFDYLVGILFHRDFSILEAYKVPHALISQYAHFSEHVNGHILTLSGPILSDPSVERIDARLREAT